MRRPNASRLTGTLALLAALAVVLAACGGGSSGSSKATIAGLKANDHGSKDVTGLTTLVLETDNYYFNPTVLTGKPGQKLTITLKNESGTEHNFTQEAQRLDTDVQAGKTEMLQVTFPPSGVISFFCKYHKDLAMAGGLQSA